MVHAQVKGCVGSDLLMFSRYGKIVSTKAILDKTTNKCKGELHFKVTPLFKAYWCKGVLHFNVTLI